MLTAEFHDGIKYNRVKYLTPVGASLGGGVVQIAVRIPCPRDCTDNWKIVEFCPDAKIIHMDIDPSEVSKLKHANIGLVGDVRATLADLEPLIYRRDRKIWRNQVEVLQEMYPMTLPETIVPEKPYGLILKVE